MKYLHLSLCSNRRQLISTALCNQSVEQISERVVILGIASWRFQPRFPTWKLFIVAHLYPPPRVVVLTGPLRIDATGCLQLFRSGSMQDPAIRLPRIHIPRTRVNKGKNKGRGVAASALRGRSVRLP